MIHKIRHIAIIPLTLSILFTASCSAAGGENPVTPGENPVTPEKPLEPVTVSQIRISGGVNPILK